MNKNIIKYIIIAILYVILMIELMVVIHTFDHYNKVKESVKISEKVNEEMNNTQVEEQAKPGNIEKVKERNEFYTAVSCVNKYLEYIYYKDAQATYECLNQSYIEGKEITENNVLDKVEKIDSKCSFTAKTMYAQEIEQGIIQYYAYGKLTRDSETEGSIDIKDLYISIIINRKTGSFTILPDTYIN